ncbi:M23 family metallopeptidase [Aquimarina longa]|uniref:M23 family metallopeptidase n=1 Tax=Aquimarina longa TaxID=1080221 RepID=UPI0007851A4C|nr:M23 family metallopeptidase [Aquimarina longa]
MSKLLILILFFVCISCKKDQQKGALRINHPKTVIQDTTTTQDQYQKYPTLFTKNPDFIAYEFDYPVGKPNGKGYYNAQKFTENNHLGDDWNGVGGGNTDLRDPIYAIANGYIFFAKDIKGGWGNVIRIIHQYKGQYYESVYAHCDTILVAENTFIKKGAQIGTIGNANGIYYAHLHLEIRDHILMDIGGGYSENTSGYVNPTEFINNN